jgi:signal transduction histidine kinase
MRDDRPGESLAFLDGGGALGELMRQKDWTGTPVGPIAAWPQSLRTAVSVMLTSPQPSYIFWGPELAILYNDRGLPFVGHKHPDCLGHTIREVLKEAWPLLGPLVEGVMTTGIPVYLENLLIPLDRAGFLQDGYFTFSYIAIRNEASAIGGILVLVNETTAQVLGERRLALIREQSLRTAVCQTVAEVLTATEAVLAESAGDIPFALLYELRGDEARLIISAGIERNLAASPLAVDLRRQGGWPLAAARDRGEQIVDDVAARFGTLPGGPSGEPAQRALVLPLVAEREAQARHVLVAGLNPRYLLDDDARSFLQLLVRQVATSITGARALEEKTLRANQLAELDRQKTEFFSNVSHEFRTPLTLMLGPLEDALERNDTLGAESLAPIHRNALRLLKLVNNLLDFARVEAGRARASHRATNLAGLTADLASGFRSAIEGAGITLEIDCEPSAAPTFVDVDMWEKIVLNLLSNAFKFTFSGTIAVTLRQRGDDVVLAVKDTGVGIAPEDLPRLFDRFHRVQGVRSRTHEGSGIGLALVAELARLHGGGVDVQSRVGEGSTFTVTIPRGSPPAAAPDDAERAASAATATHADAYVEEALRWLPAGSDARKAAPAAPAVALDPSSASAARVLVVDDNADMREYLTRLLSERWTVETAADGAQALAQATARPPDVILSDLMMPGLDGLQLVRALRSDERTREVPFILLSARADRRSTAEALDAGAGDYMIKPFSARELLARVGAQLEIARVQREARQRLASFLMEAPAAIAVLRGPSLVYALANERYGEIVGRRDLLGKPARVVLPELAEQGVWDIIERVYATGETFVAEAFPADVPTGAGGALVPSFFNWVAQTTRALDGSIDGVMIFAVDVTELVRAQQRLEQASHLEKVLRAEAEAATKVALAANRSKDEFLAMLGHELRNPLAPIATALQLLRLRGHESGERERLVIERQVKHLEALVSDLLDVSRIAQGKIDLKRAPVEVSTFLSEAIEMASPLLEERHHRLDVRVARTGLRVDGDVGRLKQVFANLITNAAKYTEPNGHISIDARRRGDLVIIEVTDDGVGISPEMLPRVFDLFSQVPQSLARSQGGLGRGRAIVRSIVEKHGGRVRAHSDGEGTGSTFAVELPASAAEVVADEPVAAMLKRGGEAQGTRILIVDDNRDAAELLAEMLQALGHDTAVAHDGPEALRVASGFKPAIALLDIGLPVMDGYELARRLRIDPALGGLRLVAITGYGQSEDRRRSEEAGFDAHLVKPVRLDDITRVLRAAN